MTCRRGAVPVPPALSSGDRGFIVFSHLTGVMGVASAERDGGDRGRHNKKSFTFISVSSVLVSRFMGAGSGFRCLASPSSELKDEPSGWEWSTYRLSRVFPRRSRSASAWQHPRPGLLRRSRACLNENMEAQQHLVGEDWDRSAAALDPGVIDSAARCSVQAGR